MTFTALNLVALGSEHICRSGTDAGPLGRASGACDTALAAAQAAFGEWEGIEPERCDVAREWMPEPNPNDEPVRRGEQPARDGRCSPGMQRVGDFCMDQFLGALVAVYEDGSETAWSPFHDPVRFKDIYNNSVDGCAGGPKCLWGAKYKGGKKIAAFRAVSVRDAIPQANINRFSSEAACRASGKRLCSKEEWLRACQGGGKVKRFYPYPEGGTRVRDKVWGQCNDLMLGVPKERYSTMARAPTNPARFYRPCLACRATPESESCRRCPDAWELERKPFIPPDAHPPERFIKRFGGLKEAYSQGLRNACVAEVPRFAPRNGNKPECRTPDEDGGIFDLMGNKHEWVAETLPNGNGVFRGGYLDDTVLNGPGCTYATVKHTPDHSDLSTGFRCCADLLPP